MTLTTRNLLLRILFILSIVYIAALVLLCAGAIYLGIFSKPPATLRPLPLPNSFFLLKASFPAAIAAVGILLIYVPLLSRRLYLEFEKTKSVELFCFLAFLISCLTEGFRLLIPALDMWRSYTPLFIAAERAVFFGRFLAPLSFFCTAMLSASAQVQNADRCFIIMLVISVGFAASVPINVAHIMTNGAVVYGHIGVSTLICSLLIVLTFMAFLLIARQKDSVEYRRISVGYLILQAGYLILLSSDNYILTLCGAGLLFFGTYVYFAHIHMYYKWL